MTYNWQQADWPQFTYDKGILDDLEKSFISSAGIFFGSFKHLDKDDEEILRVEVLCIEALKTSEIEGQYLNRQSVQSSLRRNFGLHADNKKVQQAEQGIAEMMCDLYRTSAAPLSHEKLFSWHKMLLKGRTDLTDIGNYRSHEEPMEIISGPLNNIKVHFEAPPSKRVQTEMEDFITWFNDSAYGGKHALPALTRAGIAHLYFTSIHPFEDGNGRIGRAIVEKALSQSLGYPCLIALSHIISKKKKLYYTMLENSSRSNEINNWLIYFAKTIIEAQEYSQDLIDFIIKKSKFYDRTKDKLNPRQEKVISRIFKEGLEGFKGGLSAQNYISITKTSRATATRDLTDLVDKAIVKKTGDLKSTRYQILLT
jgi:Fic family protein